MPDFSTEERRVLERYAPRLQYDAQDACRAVDAATMTANRANLLRRATGPVIAGEPDLCLDVLARYPDGAAFETGDHLAAGPDRVGDAVRLQADPRFAHQVYGRVVPGDAGRTWLQYWLWYYDNPKTFLGRGAHEGDWELIQIALRGEIPEWVTCSQHAHGETRRWAGVARDPLDPDRPLIHVAPFSHANYFEPRTQFYFPAADHPTDEGPSLVPSTAPFGSWESWRGRWGAGTGISLLWWRTRRLGGVSPDAPIVQEQRWRTPEAFWSGGRRIDRRVVRWFKSVIWWIGRGFYPLTPEVTTVERSRRSLEVSWTLRQTWWRRSRDVLLTVHESGNDERMLLSVVVRKRNARRGRASLYLPRRAESCTVRVSAFNRVGQRSTPSDPEPETSARAIAPDAAETSVVRQ
jgi:hypothetical protein